jgi:hypothetical protein
MSTDRRLYRVFLTAGARSFASRVELAREIYDRKYDEFSTEKDGERIYLQVSAIVEYVAYCVQIGLLTPELRPYVTTSEVTWRGFELSLGEKVEDFATAHGFSVQQVRDTVRGLIDQRPARLPTPRAVFSVLKPKCEYHIFYKSITVHAYQDRVKMFVRLRQTIMLDDILRDSNA